MVCIGAEYYGLFPHCIMATTYIYMYSSNSPSCICSITQYLHPLLGAVFMTLSRLLIVASYSEVGSKFSSCSGFKKTGLVCWPTCRLSWCSFGSHRLGLVLFFFSVWEGGQHVSCFLFNFSSPCLIPDSLHPQFIVCYAVYVLDSFCFV
jgi:hypothetical protein